MSQTDAPVIPQDSPVTADEAVDQLIEDDDLVEEISIDGMCGVY